MILCSFRNLNLSFSSKVIFENAELVIRKGDKIGLLGLNGKGKSSLFKILEDEISADISQPPFSYDKSEGYSLFHVPQDLPTTIPDSTSIEDCFWFFYPEWKVQWENQEHENLEEAWTLQQGYLSYLKSLNLEDETLSIGSLSGGQKKRILLSLGLSSNRDLILWDEPTNHLDIETIRDFEDELINSDKTFILTTHDRYLLGKTTSKIFQIENKKITTFDGSYTQFLELQTQKENDRVQLLNRLQNSYRREDAWMKQGIRARGTRSKKRVENYEGIKGNIRELKENARRELSLQIEATKRKTKILVDAKNIEFHYPGHESLFKGLSFDIYRKDKIGIVGPNGVGKTTLLKIISGELTAFQGNLKNAPDIKINFFSQMRDELPLEKTPFEILGDGTDQVSLPNGQTKHVMSYFKSFLFNQDEIHRPIRTFSGGERNRLQLALNLRASADIWIFDEPTNDLDLETLLILEKTLNEFPGSVIIISHDRAFLKNCTNRLFHLSPYGMEVFEGGYEQAETYLEALALEDQLERFQNKKEMEEKKAKKQQVSITKKADPKSVQELEIQIQEAEALIEKIDALLIELGSIQTSQDSAEKLAKLSQRKEEEEEKLLSLYDRLECKNT
ncbi:MAG: ATP-binding cassette domain-containing protein [Halobacteriovoraceae bacterium]|nr:ATP-binding cassette domain-containing protein [Halobacteriovoraceae bacterium]